MLNNLKNNITTIVLILLYIVAFILMPFIGGIMYRWNKKHAIVAIALTLIAYLVNKYTTL